MSTIQSDSIVAIRYRLLDAEGRVLEETENDEVEEIELGIGELPEPVEEGLVGRSAGDDVRIEAQAPFGENDPDAIVAIPREAFAEDADVSQLEPGDMVPILMSAEEGEEPGEDEVEVVVREINDDGVVVDLNHPFAGLDVVFEIHVVEIR